MRIRTLLLFLAAFATNAPSFAVETAIKTVIKGTVVGRPESKQIAILPTGADPRLVGARVPVSDGKFEYEITTDCVRAYDLIFVDELERGAFRPATIFTDGGAIHVTLHDQGHYDDNSVQGSKTYDEYTQLQEQEKKLFDLDAVYSRMQALEDKGRLSPKALELLTRVEALPQTEKNNTRDSLMAVFRNLSPEERYSPAYHSLENEAKALFQKRYAWSEKTVSETPSIAAYHLWVQYLRIALQDKKLEKFQAPRLSVNLAEALSVFAIMEAKYPGHPYTKEAKTILFALNNINVGGQYVDFSAPDLQGNRVRLSDQIAGKVALIDLWASWCGPCRQKSMSMIPVYEKYKDRGFAIVGVARERNDTKAMEAAIKRDGYAWLNLVELNDQQNIWYTYGVGNGGGALFMVDQAGKIVAIDPTAEEVETLLGRLLK